MKLNLPNKGHGSKSIEVGYGIHLTDWGRLEVDRSKFVLKEVWEFEREWRIIWKRMAFFNLFLLALVAVAIFVVR